MNVDLRLFNRFAIAHFHLHLQTHTLTYTARKWPPITIMSMFLHYLDGGHCYRVNGDAYFKFISFVLVRSQKYDISTCI